MRKLITGVDAKGRSCLLEVVDVTPTRAPGAHGVDVARIHATTEAPPPARAPALGDFIDTSLAPGLVRWLVVEHAPRGAGEPPTTATTIHHTNALDLVFVHAGTGEMVLQDGAYPVVAGDCVVLPGVDHAMRPGPDGCRILVVSIGTAPPT
jgi:mannose-6-phosphate isomerase-like protein (cupin superfamily)